MFSVSAKHDLKIRRNWPWPFRLVVIVLPLLVIAVLLWKNTHQTPAVEAVTQSMVASEAPDISRFQEQISELRKRNAMLESELAMQQGLEKESREQTRLLTEENTQLKEELTYLQKLVSDATAEAGVRIQDVRVQPGKGNNEWTYRILLVQGGNPKDDFEGEIRITGYADDDDKVLTMVDKENIVIAPQSLKFKYYERIESVFRIPDGKKLGRIDVGVFKKDNMSEPFVIRTVSLS